jgi:hypothetical protein
MWKNHLELFFGMERTLINQENTEFNLRKFDYLDLRDPSHDILNPREQNQALIIKNLYKFYYRKDLPWVAMFWKAYHHSDGSRCIENKKIYEKRVKTKM